MLTDVQLLMCLVPGFDLHLLRAGWQNLTNASERKVSKDEEHSKGQGYSGWDLNVGQMVPSEEDAAVS